MVHAEITVAAIVVRDHHYLLVEEWVKGSRVLNQPAGHVEPGETLVDAVIRETREETAWRFTPTGFVGAYYCPHGDGRTTVRFAFCGDVDDHSGQPLDDDIIAAHWVRRGDVRDRPDLRSPLVTRAFADFEANQTIALDRVRSMPF